jgi:hypothetical protein
MEKSDPKKTSLILITSPLIIYEITFTLFVIYYIQQGTAWFKISCLAIAVSVLTSCVKIFAGYKKWNASSGDHKKILTISLLVNLFFFALYLFCLLVQADQWKIPVSPPLIVIPLLSVPPLISFAAFLYSDTLHSGI